MPETDFYYT